MLQGLKHLKGQFAPNMSILYLFPYTYVILNLCVQYFCPYSESQRGPKTTLMTFIIWTKQ